MKYCGKSYSLFPHLQAGFSPFHQQTKASPNESTKMAANQA